MIRVITIKITIGIWFTNQMAERIKTNLSSQSKSTSIYWYDEFRRGRTSSEYTNRSGGFPVIFPNECFPNGLLSDNLFPERTTCE